MCVPANEWKPENFQIIDNCIMLVKPINGITKITLPAAKLMPWQDALYHAYSLEKRGDWKIPKIDELQTILKIYGIMQINNKLKEAVWSLTTYSIYDTFAETLDFASKQVAPKDKNESLEVICIHY